MLVGFYFSLLLLFSCITTSHPRDHITAVGPPFLRFTVNLDAMPACVSCYRHFIREGALNSHLTQSKRCHWVLEKRRATEAGPLQTYKHDDDLESDPPMSDSDGENHHNLEFEGLCDTADAVLYNNDAVLYDDSQAGLVGQGEAATNPEDDVPLVDQGVDRRARVEDALDEEPVATKRYPGAGKVIGRTVPPQEVYTTDGAAAHNPYHPFASKTDWEMAW